MDASTLCCPSQCTNVVQLPPDIASTNVSTLYRKSLSALTHILGHETAKAAMFVLASGMTVLGDLASTIVSWEEKYYQRYDHHQGNTICCTGTTSNADTVNNVKLWLLFCSFSLRIDFSCLPKAESVLELVQGPQMSWLG